MRVWDLTEYACASVTHVRSAGHPSCTIYAGEYHLSGWEDGGLRVYYADPTVATAALGGTRDFAASYHTAGGTALQMPGAHGVPGAASTATGQAGGFAGSPGRHKKSGREDAGFLWSIPDAHSARSGGVTALALSHNQRFVVTGGGDARVRVWDMRSREMVSAFVEHGGPITGVCVYRDDAHVLSCSTDKSFMCWDLRKESRISQHTQRSGAVHAIGISRDQSLVMTAGQEGKLQMWDLREAAPVLSIAPVHGSDGGHALTLACGNTRDVVATGGTDGVVRLWDIRASGKSLAECAGHSGDVRKVAWSPDDKQIVSVGNDGAILLWNVYS